MNQNNTDKIICKIIIADNITDCEDNLCINKLVFKIDFEGSEFE